MNNFRSDLTNVSDEPLVVCTSLAGASARKCKALGNTWLKHVVIITNIGRNGMTMECVPANFMELYK